MSVLNVVLDKMHTAIRLLEDQETGDATVTAQQLAEERLLAIVDVLSPQEDEEQDPEASQSGQPMGDPAGGSESQNRHLEMQLRLLRQMQADINRRTAELSAKMDDEAEDTTSSQMQTDLANEQAQVAELSRVLLQQFLQSQLIDRDPEPDEKEQTE
jgi:predicted transcriptional regulator